jgi:hypothetical protein
MIDIQLPNVDVIVYLVVISGVVSWGGVEIFKKAISGLLLSKKINHQPWWFNSVCRLSSCVLGLITGMTLCGDKNISCGLIGFSAGALNSFLVMMIKKYLKKKVQE